MYVGYLYVTFKPPDSACLLFRRVWCTWVTFMSPLSPLTVRVCCLGGCGVRGLPLSPLTVCVCCLGGCGVRGLPLRHL